MTNTVFNFKGEVAYTIHYNKKDNTIRITLCGGNKTIVKSINPSQDEVEYFVYGTPSVNDVRNTFIR